MKTDAKKIMSAEMDHLGEITRFLLLDNPAFYPTFENGSWCPAYCVSTSPTGLHFAKEYLPDLCQELAEEAGSAQMAIRPLVSSENILSNRDGAPVTTARKLVDREFSVLKATAMSMPDFVIHSLSRGTRKLASVSDTIHQDVHVSAMNFLRDIENARVFIRGMIEDPIAYFESVTDRRRDVIARMVDSNANRIGAENLVSGSGRWKETGDVWVRTLRSDEGSDQLTMLSATFVAGRSELLSFKVSRFSPEKAPADMDL